MRTFVVVGVALAALIGLWLLVGGRQREPGRVAVTSTPVPTPARSAGPVASASAAPPASSSGALAAIPEGEALAEVERADAALSAHARRCWEQRTPYATPPGKPDETTQFIRLDLEIDVEDGHGRLRLATIAEDGLVDAALRACVVDGLGEVRWPTTGPPGRAALRALVRMGRFTVPVGPPTAPPPGPGVIPRSQMPPPPPSAALPRP